MQNKFDGQESKSSEVSKFTNQRVSYLQITESAKQHINALLKENKEAVGIRLCLKPNGCSGMKYSVEYAEPKVNITEYDDLYETEEIKIFIEPKISMWIVGTVMDYEEDPLNSGFIFKNPNEKGRCGCGESFYV